MAFCKNCGTNLDGANFCPSCGAAAQAAIIPQQTFTPASTYQNTRQQTMAQMDDMVDYFTARTSDYLHCDELEDRIAKLKAKSFAGWLTAGVICAALAILLLCIGSSDNYFLATLVMLTPPAAMIALYVLLTKKNKEKIQAANVELAQLSTELDDYYNAYGYCPIGKDYTHPVIIMELANIIRQGRANTPAEAINILLDDQHKYEMEQTAIRTAIAAEAGARAAEGIEQNTREAAQSARKAANYASANFWLK